MTDWQDRANCLGVHPDVMFPPAGSGTTDPAKAICKGCTVRAECLQYALDNGIRHGVWGGLTEWERRKLRKTSGRSGRPRLGHGTRSCYAAGCRLPACVEAAAQYRARRRA